MENEATFTAFAGERRIASGDLRSVLRTTKEQVDAGESERVLLFDDETGRQVDVNLHGAMDEMLAREAPVPPPRRGRPRLGVVSREVSLLPRHWEWLEQQPNGISAALRRLVEDARKRDPGKERARLAREATGRVMTTLAGNLPNFEEASRALYAVDRARFEALIGDWPEGIREHLTRIADPAFRADE